MTAAGSTPPPFDPAPTAAWVRAALNIGSRPVFTKVSFSEMIHLHH